MPRNPKKCKCGRMMRGESEICEVCAKTAMHVDDYTPHIQSAFQENLRSRVPIKTLAKHLAKNHTVLKALTWDQIKSRLIRERKRRDNVMKDEALARVDFSVIGTPPQLSGGAELWLTQEKKSCDYLDEHLRSDERRIIHDTNLPIGICFVGDQHIGNEGTNHKLMREDAALIASTPGMYAILGGDGWDNHIKHLAAIINAKSAPADQAKMFVYYVSLFKSKILAVISGNHEAWTKQVAGIDVLKMLIDHGTIVYHPHGLKLTLQVGEREYRLYIRHKTQYNSSMNPTHTIKQLFRFGDWPFDIGFRGDQHEADIEEFRGHGLMRWAIRGSSYEVLSEFGEMKGYARPIPICPVVILWPDERRIDGYSDLRKAILPLKAARDECKKRLAG